MPTQTQQTSLNNVMSTFGSTSTTPDQQRALAEVFSAFGGAPQAPSAAPSAPQAPAVQTAEDPFMTQIKQELEAQKGIISSSEADVNKLIADSISTIKEGAASSAKAIETQFGRLAGYQADENTRAMTAATEAQRGFATNMALLGQIKEQGERSLNDLEQRKQELILSGNAAAAQTVSGLQLKQAEMMLQNRQQVFSNLISMAGVGLQAGSLNLQKQQIAQSQYQFEVGQQNKIGDLALKYGIKINPGDTMESVINRAYPIASEMAKAELDDMRLGMSLKRAQIALTNAQAGKIGTEQQDTAQLAEMLKIYGTNSTFGQLLLDAAAKGGNIGAVANLYNKLGQPQNYSDDILRQKAAFAYSSNLSIGDFIESIKTDSSIANKARAEEVARMYYNAPKTQLNLELKDLFSNPSVWTMGASALGGPAFGSAVGYLTR
jgi:hypothetical protein